MFCWRKRQRRFSGIETPLNTLGDDGHIYVNSEECKTALETALNNLKVDEVYNSGYVKITADIINTLKSKISVKAN